MTSNLISNILSALETVAYAEGWLIGEYNGEMRSTFYYHGVKFTVVGRKQVPIYFDIYCEYRHGNDTAYSKISRTYLGEKSVGGESSVQNFAIMLFCDMIKESKVLTIFQLTFVF